MAPPFTLVAHDPFLAVVGELKIDLFAVKTIKFLLVLFQARSTQVFDVVLVVLIVFSVLVITADLVTTNIRVTSFA